MASSDQLPSLMQKLPQELFDQIYEAVFTTYAGSRRITSSYRPPTQLHASKSTRDTFAEVFYGNGAHFEIDEDVFVRWATSLPFEHLTMISNFNVPCICGYSQQAWIAAMEVEAICDVICAHVGLCELQTSISALTDRSAQVKFRLHRSENLIWTIDKQESILKYTKLPGGADHWDA